MGMEFRNLSLGAAQIKSKCDVNCSEKNHWMYFETFPDSFASPESKGWRDGAVCRFHLAFYPHSAPHPPTSLAPSDICLWKLTWLFYHCSSLCCEILFYHKAKTFCEIIQSFHKLMVSVRFSSLNTDNLLWNVKYIWLFLLWITKALSTKRNLITQLIKDAVCQLIMVLWFISFLKQKIIRNLFLYYFKLTSWNFPLKVWSTEIAMLGPRTLSNLMLVQGLKRQLHIT